MTRPPALCSRCQLNRVAWVKPRVDYCYACLPGGPFTPPACHHCASGDYFSDGQCAQCHPGGPRHLGPCRDCLAWGVYRRHGWLCWSCRWWRTHYPFGDCDFCGRSVRVGERGACRLCVEQARMLQEPGRAPDLRTANGLGQQLFLANMVFQRRKNLRLPDGEAPAVTIEGFTASPWQQCTLFAMAPDAAVVRRQARGADSELLRYCTGVVAEHAQRHGWSEKHRNDVLRSLRLLSILQDTPGAKIRATEVLQLPRYAGNIVSTLEVLEVAGLLIEDRPSQLENYFAARTGRLPAPMKAELEVWLGVLLRGSTTTPRRRSRDPSTARIHIMGITAIINGWADAGHESLAEITAEQVRAALPERGSARTWAQSGLRSLFTTLKDRKLIFGNPTADMRTTRITTTVPLPLDTDAIRAALNAADPAVALAVALVAFHAITSRELRALLLTDITGGRMTIEGRTIPLAAPARVRLGAWLDHRQRTWPATINPHLFVGRKTAPRLVPVGSQFPWRRTTLRPQALREDRILQEIHATGGDVRRICDLFGISIEAALRYRSTLEHPDLATRRARVPGT